MSFELETPEEFDHEFDDSQYLRKPGTYHLKIEEVDENPQTVDKKPAGGFDVVFSALEGEGDDLHSDGKFTETSKTFNMRFQPPKLTHKDGGDFMRRRQTKFAVAAGVMPEKTARQSGQKVTVDLQQAVGRQVIAKVKAGKPNDKGQVYLEIDSASIWHVDDPEVAAIPKNQTAINLLSPALRRKADSFDKPEKKPASQGGAQSNGNGGSSGAAKQTVPADDEV
jgi:hypothetical protein